MRYVRAFGMFWYDFLIGDRPELFIGSIAILAVVWIGIEMGLSSTLAGGVLTAAILALAGFSVWSASRRRP